MKTNKPEVVAWYTPPARDTLPVVALNDRSKRGEPLIRLSDYHTLQDECKDSERYRSLLKAEQYNHKRIGWELERTAMGDGYYGNALRVAKYITGLTDQDHAVLDRYATGSQHDTDHISLQDIAMRVYATSQLAEKPECGCCGQSRCDDDCDAVVIGGHRGATDVAQLVEALESLIKGYVNLLEAGVDQITSLGGDCDPVSIMEQNVQWLRDARAAYHKQGGDV